ncbi:condensation domain-containing protein [Flavobacterium sp. LAR06]|uniref:condensation domain-containing protein n=1 Tax=Flavobacterium sp. LAR06 TaxID=3064897 RepID=UPI0035BF4127
MHSYVQQRFWILSQFADSSQTYNIPFSLQLKGTINIEMFINVIIVLITKHEILRTVF